MIESVLIPYITSLPAISSTLGNRIYPGKAPDNVQQPYCVYSMVVATTEHTHDSTAFRNWRFQFSVFSSTYTTAATIRDGLIDALDGYSGVLGGKSTTAFLETSSHYFESATQLHHIATDFEVSQSV